MTLPLTLRYGQVKWTAVSVFADTPDDPNALPDPVPVTGTVTFTPSATVLLDTGDSPVTVMAMPVTCNMGDDGVLRDAQGNDNITLLATDAPDITPTDWTWQVSYRLNGGASRGSFSFRLPAGTTVDLSRVAPVSSSNGVAIIQGLKGDKGDPGSVYPLNSVGESIALQSEVSRLADTTRLHVVSYQKQEPENQYNGGEGIWLDLADPRAKNMLTWRLAMNKAARTIRAVGASPVAPPESDMQRIVWAGAHYYAQDQVDYANPTDIHGHWSVEVPDSDLSLRTRFEIRFVGPDGLVGLDKSLIQTATSDFVVDTSNAQRLRMRSGPGSDRLMEIANDEWGVHPRWRVGAPGNQPETGAGVGSNFGIGNFSDADTNIGWPVAIQRSNGRVYVGGSTILPSQQDGKLEGLQVNRDHAGQALIINTNLGTDAGIVAYQHMAREVTSRTVDTRITTDVSSRYVLYPDGKQEWGPGSAARDVNLYRSAADLLRSDDDFRARSLTADTDRRGLYIKTASTTEHAATIYQASATGVDIAAALNVVSDNVDSSAMYISGIEKNRGTLKIAHRGQADASDASASAISIDLQTAGSAARGIFITAQAGAGPTTGDLIDVRNNGRDDFVVKATGRVGFGIATGSTPAALLDVVPYDDVTPGVSVKARAAGTNLVEARRASDGAIRTRISRDCQIITQETAFFTGPAVQIGATASTQVGGGTNCLGLGNASVVPTTNPTGGGVMYAEAGALKWRGSNGTVTTIAPA